MACNPSMGEISKNCKTLASIREENFPGAEGRGEGLTLKIF